MNASVTIREAIEKLNCLKDGLPAAQEVERHAACDGTSYSVVDGYRFRGFFNSLEFGEDADAAILHITLHHTIGAQLAILTNWLDTYGTSVSASCISPTDPVFGLAQAILGSDE